ncbi:threonine synthase [Helicobacter trogontum]|uniref:Threonine synthase n=1 Tax=Helicobacter trogontum TaxID=50960 RepID=A0A4U8S5M6_9HELI|nr:threonine synthase [Helicobacter trogontum]TLD81115.1 threonine synthase [Helicobacter trogontum]
MQTQDNIKILAQTRSNNDTNKTFIQAMLDPNAEYGGLYTFHNIEPLADLEKLYTLPYNKVCEKVFAHLGIDIPSELLESVLKSYETFRTKDIAPLVEIEQNLYSLELYHGPTYAFKDMALQPFSALLSAIAKQKNEKYLILSATSGDTGPATLSGFANKDNIKAICIYPQGGTSDVQRLQMTTQDAKNLKIYGIKGDFDLAQSTLKSLLKSERFRELVAKKGYALSAANSVNIARIAFQIVYYFIIGKELAKKKLHEFSVIIPSGNFGNALGAFFAKKMGLPITKICIASNPNDILTEFFTTGVYDIRDKKLKLSYSPAMDILKSSNIERLLFAYFGATRTKECMQALDETQYFKLNADELSLFQDVFEAKSFSDDECLQGIKMAFEKGYVLDPHTSNAYLFAQHRNKTLNTNIPQVIVSTAHFAKFAKVVCKALCSTDEAMLKGLGDKEALDQIFMLLRERNITQNGLQIDSSILDLFSKKELHTQIYNAKDIEDSVLSWL